MWSIHTTEYYPAIKKNVILTPTTTWINLENITLSKISQTQKDKYCMIPLIGVKFKETESRLVIAGGWVEGGMGGYCLETDAGDGCTTT